MAPSADLATDLAVWPATRAQLVGENARLRRVNAQMLAALTAVLPILRDSLPATIDLDGAKEAVVKVQDALAEAEQDA